MTISLELLEKLLSPVGNVLNLKTNVIAGFKRLHIISVRDLLLHVPNYYNRQVVEPNLNDLTEGMLIVTTVKIVDIKKSANKKIINIIAENKTGKLVLTYFNAIPEFIANLIKIGMIYVITGKVTKSYLDWQICHPELLLDKRMINNMQPVYNLTYGMTSKQIHGYILRVLDIIVQLSDKESEDIKQIFYALSYLHCNNTLTNLSYDEIEQILKQARTLLALNELIANQLFWCKVTYVANNNLGNQFTVATRLKQIVLSNLGFSLTKAQTKAIAEIEQDQKTGIRMQRLLQGDVGSGKTLVAMLTMVNVVNSGYQAALMVPTDLLANQHYQLFVKALKDINIEIALLTGSVSAKSKKEILQKLELGVIDILIGTHALFQDKVLFHNLAYVIIDEQHRFGVQQRCALIEKADKIDLLIMTATPIPRSLTLTMFGNMAVSKLQEKPKDRLPIHTSIVPKSKLNNLISSLKEQVAKKSKIYWVCPLIDKKEEGNAQKNKVDLESRYQSLREIFGDRVLKMHGKMAGSEKDIVMENFATSHDFTILVATTVIEVGIDVTDANFIVIENAEQFGLAQLHQLRGRVGRGNQQAYCIMLYDARYTTEIGLRRLEIMKETNDGFYIAEKDLELRGSGEVTGIKQSGEPEFFFAKFPEDKELLEQANNIADTKIGYEEFYIRFFTKNMYTL